ncbi:MAG: EMC3/TMCO1 family protein [Euryarchaeota archaeon]|nr:EMC3/TMCO1 family protein [Euryarchaeota archaeon]
MADKATSPAPQVPTPQKPTSSTFMTIFMLGLAMIILLDQNLRSALGELCGLAFNPIIGFDNQYPILTLVMAGLFMTGLTTLLRPLFTNFVKQAESQKIVGAYNKELRTARKENNMYKIKKLLELQPKIMEKSMEQTKSQFKLMPVSMLIIIPIFAWLAVFVGDLENPLFAVPWSSSANFEDSYLLPSWILVYSCVTIPFGQVLARTMRYFSFSKRLRELAAQGK